MAALGIILKNENILKILNDWTLLRRALNISKPNSLQNIIFLNL